MQDQSTLKTTADFPREFRDATPDEIDRVVSRAAGAADAYGTLSSGKRAEFLERIATEIEASRGELVAAAMQETSLPQARLEGETARTAGQLRLFAALIREGSWVDARIDLALPERQPVPRPDIRRVLRPLGPVAVFGASNFPLAFSVAGGDTASALAAGNPVVAKGHPAHPVTGEITAAAVLRAVAACALPEGVFGFIHGAMPAVGVALVRHPLLAGVGFTGSAIAGRALMDAAAARPNPIPVFAEMSSVNPMFVLPGAIEEKTEALAGGVVKSFTLGVGQFCTKPGIIFGIASAQWDAFCTTVGVQAKAVTLGKMLHPGIAAAFQQKVTGVGDIEWLAQGPAFVARIPADQFLQRPELGHEIFGPYTLLVTAASLPELCSVVRSLDGQLTATIHAAPSDSAAVKDLIEMLGSKVGRIVYNGFPTGVEVCPAMNHGGPFPASSDARFTSVGTAAILRFARPVCFQGFAEELLPDSLKNANPLGLMRTIDGELTRRQIA